METSPEPIEIVVCSECSQSWQKHLDEASRRITLTRDPVTLARPRTWQQATDEQVTLRECVELLLVINQGLIGKTGPTGAKGATGEQGEPGESAS